MPVLSSAEGSGRTVEAAVAAAVAGLGVEPDQVDVEVLQEPVARSFGTVGQPARVRVTRRDPSEENRQERTNESALADATSVLPEAGPEERPSASVTIPAAPVATSVLPEPRAEERPTASVTTPKAPAAASRSTAPQAITRPAARADTRRASVPEGPEGDEELADMAGDFLEGLLDVLDLEADITTWADEHGGHVELQGPELKTLVGSGGEVLAALEELMRLAVVRRIGGGRARVSLDIEGFRNRRRQEIEQLALAAAERVRSAGLPEELPAMLPYERRVAHDVIAAVDGLRTESVGDEPRRRVSILPA